MKSIKTDRNDFAMDGTSFSFVTGDMAKRQQIETLLSINKGEWFLDLSLGLEYSAIVGKGRTDAETEQAFVECLSQLPFFDYLSDFEITLEPETRLAEYRFNVVTKEDEPIYMKGVLDIG